MKKSLSCLVLACLLVLCFGGTARALSSPTIGAIIPASAPNDRDAPVVITGTGFATDGATLPTVLEDTAGRMWTIEKSATQACCTEAST